MKIEQRTKVDPINVRLEDRLMKIVESRVKEIQKRNPGMQVSRSDAIREIIAESAK